MSSTYAQQQAQALWTYNGIVAKGYTIIAGKATKVQ